MKDETGTGLGSTPEGEGELEGEGVREGVQRMRGLVAALRSGEYEQGRGYLQIGGKFCCLGVACEVAMKAGLHLDTEQRGLGAAMRIWYGMVRGVISDGSDTSLPLIVQEWFGLSASNPSVRIPKQLADRYTQAMGPSGARLADVWTSHRRFTATTLNDDYRLSLPEIADCFEYTFLPVDWAARVEG